MQYIGFTSLDEAKTWRRANGGWIFHADTSEVIWFSSKHPASVIMRHRATAGLTGELL